jgi:AcrR family transcriptional regulator
MHRLFTNIKIQIPEKLFLKDPESSEVGKKILEHSVFMIDELGFEAFTFKKLGERIGSPESTVYRYFENKHKLLIYLISWYWGWLEYKVVFSTANIEPLDKKLEQAIRAVTESVKSDSNFTHIDEQTLQKIVVAESTKAFLTKEVDQENQEGYFNNYQRLCSRLSDIVLEVNADYGYAHTLVSTIMEGCHLQKFFGRHLPSLTDTKKDDESLSRFFIEMAQSMISK